MFGLQTDPKAVPLNPSFNKRTQMQGAANEKTGKSVDLIPKQAGPNSKIITLTKNEIQ